MSTAMAQIMDRDETYLSSATTFPLVSSPSQTLARLTYLEAGIISSLDTQTDDEIFDARQKSKSVERFGWRVQCACDYIIVGRAEKLKGGRGVSDVLGKGRNAALRKQSKKIGVTAETIRKNALVYDLFKQATESSQFDTASLDILDEKGYYLAALGATDPLSALSFIAKQKSTLHRFRVTDAYRFLVRQGLTKKSAQEKTTDLVRSASRKDRFTYLKRLEFILNVCPDTDMLSRLGLQDCLDDVKEELSDMMSEDAEKAIKEFWSVTCQTEQQISDATGFSLKIIAGLIRSSNEFIKVPNTVPQRWHKVGEPLPPELRNGHQ